MEITNLLTNLIKENQKAYSSFPKDLFIVENVVKLSEYVEDEYPKCELIRQSIASEFNHLKSQVSSPTQTAQLSSIFKYTTWKVVTIEMLDLIFSGFSDHVTIRSVFYQSLNKELECKNRLNAEFSVDLSIMSFRSFHSGVIGALSSLKNEIHQKQFSSQLKNAPSKEYSKASDCVSRITFDDELNYKDEEKQIKINHEEELIQSFEKILNVKISNIEYIGSSRTFSDGAVEFNLNLTDIFIYSELKGERKITKSKKFTSSYLAEISQGPSFVHSVRAFLISPDGVIELSSEKLEQIRRL